MALSAHPGARWKHADETEFQLNVRMSNAFGLPPCPAWECLARPSSWRWDNWYEARGRGRPYRTGRGWWSQDSTGTYWTGPSVAWLKRLAARYIADQRARPRRFSQAGG